jgi:ABC-type transport system involved in cytochrome c biogenesis permease subunit
LPGRLPNAAKMIATYAVLTILLYLTSLGLYLRSLYSRQVLVGRAASLCLASGLVFHYLLLFERSRWVHSVPYQDLYGSMSLFGWLLALTYLGLELFHRERSVGAFVVPIVLVLLIAAGSIGHRAVPLPPPAKGVVFALHVTLSILAYAAFALSFVLSAMFLLEERVLRRHKMGTVVWRFPPLELLERMSRSSVIVGLVTIFAGTILGYVSADRLTGRLWHSDPKYLVTILVLFLYAAYLLAGRSTNWRGARASKLCVFNFAIVILSFTVVNIFLTKSHRYF